MTDTLTDNILVAYHSASAKDRQDGMSWFNDALALSTELSPDDPRRGAGVLAALSPMTAWPLNRRKAILLFESGQTYGIPDSVDKAMRIYNGESPLDVLRGPKVTAFYDNIVGNRNTVTVDRHAFDVAYGYPGAYLGMGKGKVPPIALRREVGHAYVDSARVIGIAPAELQAIVWVYWRRYRTDKFYGD